MFCSQNLWIKNNEILSLNEWKKRDSKHKHPVWYCRNFIQISIELYLHPMVLSILFRFSDKCMRHKLCYIFLALFVSLIPRRHNRLYTFVPLIYYCRQIYDGYELFILLLAFFCTKFSLRNHFFSKLRLRLRPGVY